METSQMTLYRNLIKWIKTLHLQASHSNAKDLSDGVAMAEVLAQIAPEYFLPWVSKIKSGVSSNWRLKMSNLKKIFDGITEYYRDVLNVNLVECAKPDLVKIAEGSDEGELLKLLQLILGCALNCDRKQEYITNIMELEESCQCSIMEAIQEIETLTHGRNRPSMNLDTNPAVRSQLDEQARETLAQRCYELDLQVKVLTEEKATLLQENLKLTSQLQPDNTAPVVNEYGDSLGPALSGTVRYNDMRRQVDKLKDELFEMETLRDDYKAKLIAQERELLVSRSRISELQVAASEMSRLKDEVDALRESADKVLNYENTIESYKKRMEKYVDLKKQVTHLEQKNIEYVQRNIEYEEDAKKYNALKGQLEIYKNQVTDLNEKLDGEITKADKLEIENKKLGAKLLSLQRERDNFLQERDTLKETCEELRCSTVQTGASADNVSRELIPNDIKEKLVRLEHENKLLRQNQGSQSDQASVQALLEDYVQRLEKLRNLNREANQKIMQLEVSLEEAKDHKATASTQAMKGINQAEIKLVQALEDNQRKTIQLEDTVVALQAQKQKSIALQESLAQKEAEIVAMEEKYKRCIDKAKEVIKTLNPRTTGQQSLETTLVQGRLTGEKSSGMNQAANQPSSSRTAGSQQSQDIMREGEERLMASAFFKLGIACQRDAVDQKLALLSSGQSFLARQRQAAPRKPLHSLIKNK